MPTGDGDVVAHSHEYLTSLIQLVLRDERRRIVRSLRDIKIYTSNFASSDPFCPFSGGTYLSKEDAELLLGDIANAILGEDDEC
jgi:hypothetical protein